MERAIVHMDLDTFFVSCERLKHSALEGIPVIIGGGDRGVVASCSYEARYFGVHSAMPMKLALRLCPHARVIRGDMEEYSRKSREVTQALEDRAPVVEKASIDEHYLDISGIDRFFGAYKWTQELMDYVRRETGLPVSYALSVNKTVAKIGTGEAKPAGKIQIPQDHIQPFLNPLSIKKIPMLGDVTFRLLSRIGIRYIHTLAGMPVEVLQQMIGKNGIEIWKKANGIDNSPVEPYTERKSISTENTFANDTIDLRMLHSVISGMTEKLAYQLRKEGWLTSTVTVKIRYANFDTETRQMRVPYTSADHPLTQCALDLFTKLYNRRMRLRLVGVRFSGLVRGNLQIRLFEDTEEMISLYQAMDRIRNRFGPSAVGRAEGFYKP